jgi:ankyrin repeat protein
MGKMKSLKPVMKQAQTYEELIPLVNLCKTGKLFEAQDWILAGKPINLPVPFKRKGWERSPLQVAMDCGFHSLVKVLLEGGAEIEEPNYLPLQHAVFKRRIDLADLLVKNGAEISSVDMETVFDSWNTDIVEYFIAHGADVETGHPLAHALCSGIRPALGLLKRYKDRYPSFQEQANIALRHHCLKGSVKWTALMLWAGADPYAKGPASPGEDPDPDEDNNALELAAFFGHSDIFKLKILRLDPKRPGADSLLRSACHAEEADILKILLEKGFDPKEREDIGSSLIEATLSGMSWDSDFDPFSYTKRQRKNLDKSHCREKIKMLHMLVRHGAKWEPEKSHGVDFARGCLLKMIPDYTMEFIWIMTGYKACSPKNIEELLRTPSIRSLISNHLPRIAEMMESLGKNESN